MNLDAALQTFIAECRELLEEMENALLSIEQNPDRDEAVNAIFRAAHTIKGSAGLFGLDHIVAFTHVAESVLDGVRDGQVQIDDSLVVLLLSCCDHLTTMVQMVDAGQTGNSEALERVSVPLLTQLRQYLKPSSTEVAAPAPEPEAQLERISRDDAAGDARNNWHISLRFGPDVLRNGMDPLSFIRYLGQLGRVVGIATLHDAMPPATAMDPETCYLGFEIAFASNATKDAIEGVFEFVRDDCSIRIIPPHSRLVEYADLIQQLPELNVRLGDILVLCGSITRRELAEALAIQQNAQADALTCGQSDADLPKLGDILVEQNAVEPSLVEAALAKQKQITDKQKTGDSKSSENRSIRIDADKLDQLINLVGELIIEGATSNLLARRSQMPELQESTSRLSGLVQEVRDSALQLRMVKIGATFTRFQRVVYDVSREIGKDIGLQISGEETELDKTVVEKIGDPLMHLVRNAMDHGIEPADLRQQRGKSVKGSIRLNAFHDSGSIVIEVSDDGGGLKKDRILAKALERGLIDADQRLSDKEIFDLIFEPGFSTADQITNLSGRGVGMDVVKRNITSLRGTISLHSEEGVGTTVSVRLPLTLAIIDGFLVGVGKAVFVVPLDMIDECVEFSAEGGHDYCNLRGQVLPLVRLRQFFSIEAPAPRRESVVVLKHAGQKFGMVVDNLLGEFQTVIKPLSRVFQQVKCISGSTILGSGEVALILDVPSVFKDMDNRSVEQRMLT
ncbi:chemotaxis protein CheA [Rhodoferax sp. AJA081-3]|uniref:chemotaxis protein CheA n=1 Tax=Rhodoferax sp. AJA081-3 TaxID=2752316 RepID=UPI001AE015C8|nr:chemotaxis protein CheA [Rhodoferax sp. AJA081-3]QTN28971.1 chemotaxis protein CheA [Rhodoferax sp. AJA081-3]